MPKKNNKQAKNAKPRAKQPRKKNNRRGKGQAPGGATLTRNSEYKLTGRYGVSPRTGVGSHLPTPTPQVYYKISGYREGKRTGMRLDWCGPIAICNTTAAGGVGLTFGTYNTFYSTSAMGTGVSAFYLNPWTCLPRGSTAAAVFGFSRFKFLNFGITWVGSRSTSANEVTAIGYDPDGAAEAADFSYSTMVTLAKHAYIPVWTSGTQDFSGDLDTTSWYYVDQDTGISQSDAGWRQSYQGMCLVAPNSIPGSGSEHQGIVYSHGSLIVVDAQPYQQDIAVQSSSHSKRKMTSNKEEVKMAVEEPVVVEKPPTVPRPSPPARWI